MASLLAFAGVSVGVEWIVFLLVSIATLAALRPLAHRLDRNALDHGVGARRLVGSRATVLQDIPGDAELGMVRVGREEWRAQADDGRAIGAGTRVKVLRVTGTRLSVEVDDREPALGSGREGEQ